MEVSTTQPTTASIASVMLEKQAPAGAKSAGASTLGRVSGIVRHNSGGFQRCDAVKRRFALQDTARSLLPDWRVADCLRVPVNPLVSIIHHPQYQIASYTGLHTCGNVHVCPVCGAKIAERRTQEINRAASAWLDKGGGLIMATLTLQHEVTDSLAYLGDAMNEGYRVMRRWRAWRNLVAEYGLVGGITARETTHGLLFGWHPHMHALFFVRGDLSWRELKAFEQKLQALWARAMQKNGQYASLRYGVKCQLSKDGALAEYVTKSGKQWTIGDELAKANRKKARSAGGRSVAQLLADAGDGDKQAGTLFQEYAHATYRKNALVWSPGLRALLGLEEELTDEALAQEESANGSILITLRRHQWYIILRARARADVLLVAGAGDAAQVAAYVLERFGIVLEAWQLNPQQAPLESAPDALSGPLCDESGHGGTIPRDLQSKAVLERARSWALAPPG